MASTPAPARLRSIYRSILRELPPRPILASPRAPLHTRLRANFETAGSASSPSSSASSSVQQAEQLAAYLRAQRCYVTLVERYNPGMNMEDEERIRLTARRVGLDMPEEFAAAGKGSK
jgi:hypothetical protein